MIDFLLFRRMIATVTIQIFFWLGVLVLFVISIGIAAREEANAGAGVLVFLVGLVYLRILCEILIVFFRINDTLTIVKNNTLPLRSLQQADAARAGTQTGRLWGDPNDSANAPRALLAEGDRWALSVPERGEPAPKSPTTGDAGATPASGQAPSETGASSPPEERDTEARVKLNVRYCSQCGKASARSNRFCESCGASLGA